MLIIIFIWFLAGFMFSVWHKRETNKIFFGSKKIKLYQWLEVVAFSVAGLTPYVVCYFIYIKEVKR